jgi:hypothetical protein
MLSALTGMHERCNHLPTSTLLLRQMTRDAIGHTQIHTPVRLRSRCDLVESALLPEGHAAVDDKRLASHEARRV